jgi:hypothetical protein
VLPKSYFVPTAESLEDTGVRIGPDSGAGAGKLLGSGVRPWSSDFAIRLKDETGVNAASKGRQLTAGSKNDRSEADHDEY